MICKHKQRTACKIPNCKNKQGQRKRCQICGKSRWRNYCKSHKADGSKKKRNH